MVVWPDLILRGCTRATCSLRKSKMGIGQILNDDRQLRRIHTLFYDQGLRQVDVARKLRVSQQAVSKRIRTIRSRYIRAGLTPPANPGTGLRTVRCVGLPSYN